MICTLDMFLLFTSNKEKNFEKLASQTFVGVENVLGEHKMKESSKVSLMNLEKNKTENAIFTSTLPAQHIRLNF